MTTLNLQVGASADDGGWWAPDVFANYNAVFVGSCSDAIENMWARWTGITIPAGSVVTSAYVSLYESDHSGSPTCRIYFNKSASPSSPTSYSDAVGKTKTTAYVSWSMSTVSGWVTSPDISSVVQEMLDAYGAFSSGAMMALLIGTGTGTNDITVNCYDYEPSQAPKLEITYVPRAGGRQVRVIGMMM